jgi:dienelactone hydrolase
VRIRVFFVTWVAIVVSAACNNGAPSMPSNIGVGGAPGISAAGAVSGTGAAAVGGMSVSAAAGGGATIASAAGGTATGTAGAGSAGAAAATGGKGGTLAAAGGGAGSGGAAGSGATAGTGAAGMAAAADCGKNLLAIPDDVSVRGPWDIGVRTVQVGRLKTEVMYPAEPGSTTGKPEATYDLREWLPAEDRDKVPTANSPRVGPFGGLLYRDVPVDSAHGPYPLVIFIHGTASMRIASGTLNAHWASRGFVVLAADYPGLGLTDKLNETCGRDAGTQDLPGDVDAQIAALNSGSGDLAFLKGRVDMTRLAISGHSQGGCVSAELSGVKGVQVVMPLSGSMPSSTPTLKSLLYVSGMSDQVIGYDSALIGNVVCSVGASSSKAAYADSVVMGPKRVVGITGGGHLVPTDLCQNNAQGRNAIQEAQADGVCGIDTAVIIGLPALFDCGMIDLKKGLDAVIYPTTAALEETLHCMDRTKAWADMRMKLPQIGEFEHTP